MRYTVYAVVTAPRGQRAGLRVSRVNAASAEQALRWAAAAAKGEGLRVREAAVADGWPEVQRFAPGGGKTTGVGVK